MARSRLLFALCVCCLAVAVPASLGQAASYEVRIDGDVDVPDRTISTEWGDRTISSIGRVDEGEYLRASTVAPAGESYSIRVVDSRQRLRDSAYATGDGSVTFDLDRYDPGTYAVALTNGSEELYAVEPFVVRGYAVEQSVPAEVAAGSTMTVEVRLRAVHDEVSTPPDAVQVIVGDDRERLRVDAERESGLTYVATIDVGSLAPGTYEAYAEVQRDEEVFGARELVGLSDAQAFAVVEATGATATATATDAGGGGGAQTSPGTAEPTTASTPDTAAPTTGAETPVGTGSTAASTSDGTGDAAATSRPPTPTPSTAAPSSTPATSAADSGTTSTASPAFADGPAMLLVALLGVAAVRLRR
jgi:hypothetical protein